MTLGDNKIIFCLIRALLHRAQLHLRNPSRYHQLVYRLHVTSQYYSQWLSKFQRPLNETDFVVSSKSLHAHTATTTHIAPAHYLYTAIASHSRMSSSFHGIRIPYINWTTLRATVPQIFGFIQQDTSERPRALKDNQNTVIVCIWEPAPLPERRLVILTKKNNWNRAQHQSNFHAVKEPENAKRKQFLDQREWNSQDCATELTRRHHFIER